MWALETGILVFERPLWSKKAKCLKRVVFCLLEKSNIRKTTKTCFGHKPAIHDSERPVSLAQPGTATYGQNTTVNNLNIGKIPTLNASITGARRGRPVRGFCAATYWAVGPGR
jgi:hypothetical protein